MLGKEYVGQDCGIARALEVFGERWTLLIVRDALYGVRRFRDFQAHLDIPKAVLSDRLNGLVEHGILERRPDPHHAGRSLYELTEAGRDLWPVLHAMVVGATTTSSRTAAFSGTPRAARCSTTPRIARRAGSRPRSETSSPSRGLGAVGIATIRSRWRCGSASVTRTAPGRIVVAPGLSVREIRTSRPAVRED